MHELPWKRCTNEALKSRCNSTFASTQLTPSQSLTLVDSRGQIEGHNAQFRLFYGDRGEVDINLVKLLLTDLLQQDNNLKKRKMKTQEQVKSKQINKNVKRK